MADAKDLISTAAADTAAGTDVNTNPEPAQDFGNQNFDNQNFGNQNLDNQSFDIGAELTRLITANPELANVIADAIENYFSGNRMSQPAAPMIPPQLVALIDQLNGRLSTLEQVHADSELEKELNEAKQEYEAYKKQLPLLPDFNEKEILQTAYQLEGIPLKDALQLWIGRKLRELGGDEEGETLIDKLVAMKLDESKGKQVPPIMTKGGSAPATVEQKEPTSMREANRQVRELLGSLFGGGGA